MRVNIASIECQQSVNRVSTEHQQSVSRASTECQRRVNNFGGCILYYPRALLWHLFIIEVLGAAMDNMASVNFAIHKNECQQNVNRFSTEYQQSVNDFGCCILYITMAVLWHLPMIKVLASIMDNMVNVDIVPA